MFFHRHRLFAPCRHRHFVTISPERVDKRPLFTARKITLIRYGVTLLMPPPVDSASLRRLHFAMLISPPMLRRFMPGDVDAMSFMIMLHIIITSWKLRRLLSEPRAFMQS